MCHYTRVPKLRLTPPFAHTSFVSQVISHEPATFSKCAVTESGRVYAALVGGTACAEYDIKVKASPRSHYCKDLAHNPEKTIDDVTAVRRCRLNTSG